LEGGRYKRRSLVQMGVLQEKVRGSSLASETAKKSTREERETPRAREPEKIFEGRGNGQENDKQKREPRGGGKGKNSEGPGSRKTAAYDMGGCWGGGFCGGGGFFGGFGGSGKISMQETRRRGRLHDAGTITRTKTKGSDGKRAQTTPRGPT